MDRDSRIVMVSEVLPVRCISQYCVWLAACECLGGLVRSCGSCPRAQQELGVLGKHFVISILVLRTCISHTTTAKNYCLCVCVCCSHMWLCIISVWICTLWRGKLPEWSEDDQAIFSERAWKCINYWKQSVYVSVCVCVFGFGDWRSSECRENRCKD